MLNVSKCIKRIADTQKIKSVEVLPDKNKCEEKCLQKSCRYYYDLNIKFYVARCQPKTFQQKQFSLCSRKVTDSKGNVFVVSVVSVIALSTLVGALTYLYRRHKTTNRFETVSKVLTYICFTTVLVHLDFEKQTFENFLFYYRQLMKKETFL